MINILWGGIFRDAKTLLVHIHIQKIFFFKFQKFTYTKMLSAFEALPKAECLSSIEHNLVSSPP